MQKREQGKSSGGLGGATAPLTKRGRPFGSTSNNTAASASAADIAIPSTLLDPSLHVHSSFTGQFSKTLREKVLIFAKKFSCFMEIC